MSEEHKAALAVGRAEGRKVRAYLEALSAMRPKRGRKRTPESVAARLSKLAGELETADALKRLQLTQEQMELEEELAAFDGGTDLDELEAEFVEVARSYAERKGITYAAFRQLGVPASVLKKANIARGRRASQS